MTARGPKRSSKRPATIVETPASRFAAMPKIRTSLEEKWNATAAITAPNAKTPASPSRNTALASRNQNVGREPRQSAAMSCPSTT